MAKKKQQIRICSSFGIHWWLKTRHQRAGRGRHNNRLNRRNRIRRNPNHPNNGIDLSEVSTNPNNPNPNTHPANDLSEVSTNPNPNTNPANDLSEVSTNPIPTNDLSEVSTNPNPNIHPANDLSEVSTNPNNNPIPTNDLSEVSNNPIPTDDLNEVYRTATEPSIHLTQEGIERSEEVNNFTLNKYLEENNLTLNQFLEENNLTLEDLESLEEVKLVEYEDGSNRILHEDNGKPSNGEPPNGSSGLLSKSDEEPNGEPPNGEPPNDEEQAEFFLKIESHANCNLCEHKITGAMQFSNAKIIDWELVEPNKVKAIGVADLDESVIEKEMSQQLGRRTCVVIVNGNCDDANDNGRKLRFDNVKFTSFKDSFVNRVGESLNAKWGSLYENTFSKVYRVKCVDENTYGTAFLILKEARSAYFLTCAHIFEGCDQSSKIELIGSNFKPFQASILFCCPDMDFCLLKGDDLGSLPEGLGSFLDEITFGEEVFSISTPIYSVQRKSSSENLDIKDLAQTFWFPLSVGYVQHPWLVEMHHQNKKGEMMMLSLKGLGKGASGAPILNSNGKVIGVFLSALSDEENPEDAVNLSLRLTSIRNELVDRFAVPPERQTSFNDIIFWVAHNINGDADVRFVSEPGSG